MEIPRNLLEAERILWYKKLPVPEGWHGAYARGEIDQKNPITFSPDLEELCLQVLQYASHGQSQSFH